MLRNYFYFIFMFTFCLSLGTQYTPTAAMEVPEEPPLPGTVEELAPPAIPIAEPPPQKVKLIETRDVTDETGMCHMVPLIKLDFVDRKDGRYELPCSPSQLLDALYNEKHAQLLNEILLQSPDLVFVSTPGNNFTFLHVAVAFGNTRAVAILIARGAPVAAFDSAKRAPLHWAALCGHTAIATMLLDAGAPIMTVAYPEMLKKTALHFAAQGGFISIMQLLINYFCRRHPNIPAQKLIRFIIKQKDSLSHSPLNDASQEGQYNAVHFLRQKKIFAHQFDHTSTYPASLDLLPEERKAIKPEFGYEPVRLVQEQQDHTQNQQPSPTQELLDDEQVSCCCGCFGRSRGRSVAARSYRVHPTP